MSGEDVLDRLLAAGVRLQLGADGRVYVSRPYPPDLVALARARRTDVYAAARARACSGCGTLDASYCVESYWKPAERYCPGCCVVLAERFDREDAWPAAPDVAGEAETYLRAPQG